MAPQSVSYFEMNNYDNSIRSKLSRLRAGGAPRVLDLFAGAGGLSLGFHRAGCASLGAVEIDKHAAHTYARNFHYADQEKHSKPHDITTLDPEAFVAEICDSKPHDAVDFLIGGPPCPAFTRVGRAKLREVQAHSEAFKRDPRAMLYVPFLRFAERLRPVALLMENVPDFLNWGGHNLGEEVCDVLEDLGYRCAYTLLNAANYGVPQMRERFYLVAINRLANVEPSFPIPICAVDFPPGYKSSREVALKATPIPSLFGVKTRFVPTPSAHECTRGPTTVLDAIGDLPAITGHLDGTIRRGARRFDKPIEHKRPERNSEYAEAMQRWPAFEADGILLDHVIRSLSERDYRLFRLMKPGDDYPAAHQLALSLFKQAAESNGRPAKSTQNYRSLLKSYVPPYDPSKFPNRWRKMDPLQPARTLMAHLGKDSYTHIHYDSSQARVLSVREAARLQSFPDGFAFSGTMNPAFRQIGNAVPPVMAAFIAANIQRTLGLTSEFLSPFQPSVDHLSAIGVAK